MVSCKIATTPMNTNEKLKMVDGGDSVDAYMYGSMIGGLIYVTHTQPDIAFSVGIVSRYMQKPSVYHYGAAKRIMRYLAGTVGFGLWCGKTNNVKLLGFTDSDWAGTSEDMKSLSANAFFWVQVLYRGCRRNKQ
ncbi:putative RNA-directed DNA polymerase [Helianthus debilis subsp. tardiflorus]